MGEDGELIRRCLEAKEAFAEVYHRHAPALWAYLRGLFQGDDHAAADALQDTFVKAWAALPRFDPERRLRPWLMTIATRVALDALARKRAAPVDPAALAPPVAPDDPARAASVHDACAAIVRRAGPRLPARKLATFLLARGQGLTYEEIAEVHACSTATVKRDLQEALETLIAASVELGLVTS